jgi:hypothetical protein
VQEDVKVVTLVTSAGADFEVSVEDAQAIDDAFRKTGQERLVWVTANPTKMKAVRLRLNIDQVVYIANA